MVVGVWQIQLARPDSIGITSRNWFTILGRRPVNYKATESALLDLTLPQLFIPDDCNTLLSLFLGTFLLSESFESGLEPY